MKILVGFFLAIAMLAITGLGVIYSGAYKIAATVPHTSIGSWILDTTKRRAIKVQGRGIQAPERFSDEQVRQGFKQFNEMCVTCHGAPGMEPSEVGKGLLPQPPNLVEVVRRWDRPHLFWIIKNGIKMTGMPGFGPTHSDSEIWDIVAFVETLPNMTAGQYGGMTSDHHAEPHRHSR